MKKTINRAASLVLALAIVLGSYSHVEAAAVPSVFAKALSPGNSTGWSLETSGSMEKITATTDSWVCEAGGYAASTHYARLKYKLPEQAGIVLTTFYMKLDVVLPADFYTKQTAGFRLFNTDSWSAMLNGAAVGTAGDSIYTSVYFWSDHSLRVQSSYGNTIKNFYTMPTRLPVGRHVFELYGDVANVAPWYLKIDGVLIASGKDRLSPDNSPVNGRVITRLVAGIDGAADQDANLMNIQVKSFGVANYDVSGGTTAAPSPTSVVPASPTPTTPWTPTQPPATPTTTPIVATLTNTPVPTTIINTPIPTLVEPTSTQPPVEPTSTPIESSPTMPGAPTLIPPTATPQTTGPTIEKATYDDKNSSLTYSSGWQNTSNKRAFQRSFKTTTTQGSYLTLQFTGSTFTILHTKGPGFSTIDVYVDNVLVGTINEKAGSLRYQRPWIYPGTLPIGPHELKLVFTGSGTKGSVDAIIVQ